MPDGMIESEIFRQRWAEHAERLQRLAANGRPAGEAVECAQAGLDLAREAVAAAERGRRAVEAMRWPWSWAMLVGVLLRPADAAEAAVRLWRQRRIEIAAARSFEREAQAVLRREEAAAARLAAECQELLRAHAAAAGGG